MFAKEMVPLRRNRWFGNHFMASDHRTFVIFTSCNISKYIFPYEHCKTINITTQKRWESQQTLIFNSTSFVKRCLVTEQKRRVSNYISEACAVRLFQQQPVDRICNIDVPIQRINIPILPCNFIPLEAQLYTGLFTRRSIRYNLWFVLHETPYCPHIVIRIDVFDFCVLQVSRYVNSSRLQLCYCRHIPFACGCRWLMLVQYYSK